MTNSNHTWERRTKQMSIRLKTSDYNYLKTIYKTEHSHYHDEYSNADLIEYIIDSHRRQASRLSETTSDR